MYTGLKETTTGENTLSLRIISGVSRFAQAFLNSWRAGKITLEFLEERLSRLK
jgi:hypothetical protein